MIGDLIDFRRTGVASRRLGELEIPVTVWRATMCRSARRDGARVRTFVVSSAVPPADPEEDGEVFAVRIDPPPDRRRARSHNVRWWCLDELGMPVERWRAALHRTARREGARARTFLVPARDGDPAGPLVYLVWADPDRAVPIPAAPAPDPEPSGTGVTDLVLFAATRRHPSAAGRR